MHQVQEDHVLGGSIATELLRQLRGQYVLIRLVEKPQQIDCQPVLVQVLMQEFVVL